MKQNFNRQEKETLACFLLLIQYCTLGALLWDTLKYIDLEKMCSVNIRCHLGLAQECYCSRVIHIYWWWVRSSEFNPIICIQAELPLSQAVAWKERGQDVSDLIQCPSAWVNSLGDTFSCLCFQQRVNRASYLDLCMFVECTEEQALQLSTFNYFVAQVEIKHVRGLWLLLVLPR